MSIRVLGRSDRQVVFDLLEADPVGTVFMASRIAAGLLDRLSAGELWGYPGRSPRALLHVGANVMPAYADAEALSAFAARLGPYRPCSAILGDAEQVHALWRKLGEQWGRTYANARLVRPAQPVMATERPAPIAADPRVRRITMADFESYFAAAVAMYTEELAEDPLASNPVGYRRYMTSLVEMGRAFGIVVDGEVVFKADLGAVGGGVCQVQGVWVSPRLRGQGMAAPAMAAVTDHIIASGQTASLYVNDFNAPAIATYRRCGYTQRGVFSTVLY